MDKLDLWIGTAFTLSTFVWFIFGLKISIELQNLRADLLKEIVAAKLSIDVHIAEDKVKHDQMDRHMEWIDQRIDRLHPDSKTSYD